MVIVVMGKVQLVSRLKQNKEIQNSGYVIFLKLIVVTWPGSPNAKQDKLEKKKWSQWKSRANRRNCPSKEEGLPRSLSNIFPQQEILFHFEGSGSFTLGSCLVQCFIKLGFLQAKIKENPEGKPKHMLVSILLEKSGQRDSTGNKRVLLSVRHLKAWDLILTRNTGQGAPAARRISLYSFQTVNHGQSLPLLPVHFVPLSGRKLAY